MNFLKNLLVRISICCSVPFMIAGVCFEVISRGFKTGRAEMSETIEKSDL